MHLRAKGRHPFLRTVNQAVVGPRSIIWAADSKVLGLVSFVHDGNVGRNILSWDERREVHFDQQGLPPFLVREQRRPSSRVEDSLRAVTRICRHVLGTAESEGSGNVVRQVVLGGLVGETEVIESG